MKTKIISLTVLSLSVFSVAMAGEYKSPGFGFRETEPSHKDIKMAEFNEEYKVEGLVNTDRQIASEKYPGDREPSSVVADDKKAMEDEEMMPEDKIEPKPWLYRNILDKSY